MYFCIFPFLFQNYKISHLYSESLSEKQVDVLDLDAWPASNELGLDPSQSDALKIALTNELALIQGPPGTGKTHVGLLIVNTLLANKNRWNP